MSLLSKLSYALDNNHYRAFTHNGTTIINPFYDESERFQVDPIAYYGENNITDSILPFEAPYNFPLHLITSNGITFYFISYDHNNHDGYYQALDELHQVEMKVCKYDDAFIGNLAIEDIDHARDENIYVFEYIEGESDTIAYEV